MQNRMKKAVAAVCVGAMTFAVAPAAFAAGVPVNYQQESGITPYMLYITEWENSLSISGRTATVTCWVEGDYNSATKAKMVAELQEKNGSSWSTIATWTDTQNGYRAKVKETKSLTSGKTYRVKATMTVWEGSQSETHTVYGVEKTA